MPADDLTDLLGILELTREASAHFLAAQSLRAREDVEGTAKETGLLIQALERQLAEIAAFNEAHPDHPFDPAPIVNQLLDAMLTQGDLLETLGQREAAEGIRERALRLSPALASATGVAERKRQRAASLLAQGRYHDAVTALNEALDAFTGAGRTVEAAHVSVDLAELYEWLGDMERAREVATRSRRVVEPLLATGTPTFGDAIRAALSGQFDQARQTAELTAIALHLLQVEARLAREMGDFDCATALFRRVRERVESAVAPAIDFQLARIDIERGAIARGIALLKAIAPRMTGMLRPKLGAVLSWEAEAHLRRGCQPDALSPARESVTELTRYCDLDSLWKAQWRLGRALEATGDSQGALETYRAAADTVSSLRRAPLGYRLESTFMADKVPLFDDAIRCAAASRDAIVCLHLIEQVKARALTALLTVPARVDSECPLAQDVETLSTRIDTLEYQAYRRGWSAEASAERDRLLVARAQALERMTLEDPRWRSVSRAADLDHAAVLGLLAKRNQSLLSLYYRGGRIIAVLLKDGAAEVEESELGSDTIQAIEAYARNLVCENPDSHTFDPSTLPALAADRIVPNSLLGRALTAGSLIVAPHGPLHLLPWAGLVHGGQRLFERCGVGILPNVACLLTLSASRAAAPKVALLGGPDYGILPGLPPLPLAEAEIQTIADLFDDRVVGDPRIGGDATERAYREILENPDGIGGILHLACHGVFVSGDPENSGLLLADGRLDAADIARRRIRYDDVVLSACSSGYRPTRVGAIELAADDIVGLPGAFLEAGARTVLVSIPKARDDATLAFMTLFYEHRSRSEPPLSALRSAQIEMLSAGRFDPCLWIGFSLYGCS